MAAFQYKVIKTDAQYNKYCDILETLVDGGKKTKGQECKGNEYAEGFGNSLMLLPA